MTTKTFCSYMLLPLAFMLLSNCKKHHKDDPIPEPEKPTASEEIKKYIPIKFESGTKVITLKYLNNTSLVSAIENMDGRKEVYTYNSDQKPIKYERYQNNEQVYLIDYLRNADGLVVKANRFIITPMTFIPDGYNTLDYDANNKLLDFKTYNNANKLLNEEISEYNSYGDLIKKITKIIGHPDAITSLNQDNKNGVFKEVLFTELLLFNVTDDLFISAPHNITDRTEASGTTNFSYQYNTSDYPIEYTSTNANSVKKLVKITYAQL